MLLTSGRVRTDRFRVVHGTIPHGTGELQHIYDKHASDFGVVGRKNLEQLEKLRDAIQAHLLDPKTKAVQGQYRGHYATLHYNTETQNIVVADKSNNVLAGFKASEVQAGYIESTGRLN